MTEASGENARQDDSMRIEQLLAILNSKEQHIIRLICVEGFTSEEVAARIDETVSEVRHQFYRALSKLHRAALGRVLPKTEDPSEAAHQGHFPLSSLEGEKLAIALQNGHPDAMRTLFERYRRLVFSTAIKYVKDEGEAEEIVQQVFAELFSNIGKFDPSRGEFKTWLLQFAHYRSIDRHKHLSTMKFYAFEQLDKATRNRPSKETSYLRRLSAQESDCLVQQMLVMLKPMQRLVIELTYLEGLTAAEVAARIGETASVVRHHLYRGLSRLRCVLSSSADMQQPTELWVAIQRSL